ncbi:MAG: H-NS histone family protein [Dokdonella sp.]
MAIDIKSLNHNQLNELITRAKTRQDEMVKEKEGKVREKVLAMVKAEGFTMEELFGGTGARKKRGKVKPKFRNPADPSMTWTGRGKRPRWFNDAINGGKKEKDMLIA